MKYVQLHQFIWQCVFVGDHGQNWYWKLILKVKIDTEWALNFTYDLVKWVYIFIFWLPNKNRKRDSIIFCEFKTGGQLFWKMNCCYILWVWGLSFKLFNPVSSQHPWTFKIFPPWHVYVLWDHQSIASHGKGDIFTA